MKIQKIRLMSVLVAAAALSVPCRAALAAFNYGNFSAANVTYIGVSESSTTDTTPLYGSPTVNTQSNAITFGASAFQASSIDGAGSHGLGPVDTTEGDLTTQVQADSGYKIIGLSFTEDGDYSLEGSGTSATAVSVSTPVTVDILQVNGVAITPIVYGTSVTFTPASNYSLPANLGTGVIYDGSLNLMNLNSLIVANGYSGSVTEVSWDLNSTLTASSEADSEAFIKVKVSSDNSITVNPVLNSVPEPASAGLVLVGAIGAMMRRRRA